MNHNELCHIAAKWLKKSFSKGGMGCQISFVEPKISFLDGECPDAIGFRVSTPEYGGGSTVIECKTSLSDFYADMKKHIEMIIKVWDVSDIICVQKI